jgi:hypothetical protein
MKYSLLSAFFALSLLCFAQNQQGSALASLVDLSQTPTLYVVGYAHLDTQSRWEYPKTIGEYLADTLHKSFDPQTRPAKRSQPSLYMTHWSVKDLK